MGRLRVAVAVAPRADLVSGVQGERAGRAERPRHSGATIVMASFLALGVSGCGTGGGGFTAYRACYETPGRGLHDVGTVVWEELGDDARRIYGFLPDRLRENPRDVIVVKRVNRMCTLVNPLSATERSPLHLEGPR